MEESAKDSDESRRGFWAKHLSDCQGSGLSYAEYCRRHNLTEGAFGYWRKKLLEVQRGRSGFVELKVTASKRSGIEIILRNQIRISVGLDFDETVLKHLIGVVESV